MAAWGCGVFSLLCALPTTTGKVWEMWENPRSDSTVGAGEIPIHITI